MAEIFWAARDLAGIAVVGNHHFILVYLAPNEAIPGIEIKEESGKKFFTLGGHQVDGKLAYVPNQTDDVRSVKEGINASLRGFFTDFDIEKHSISAPTGGSWDFAFQLQRFAERYKANTAINPVDYHLRIRNCSTWANTLLKVAGVSSSVREANRDFEGIDWGEHLELDENLFR